jgi:hypothetical protein
MVNKVDSLLMNIKNSESKRAPNVELCDHFWGRYYRKLFVLGAALKTASANLVLILMGPAQLLPFKKFESNLRVLKEKLPNAEKICTFHKM